MFSKQFFKYYFLLFILIFVVNTASASCTLLCNENWWRITSVSEVKSIIEESPNLNARDKYGFRALHYAVKNGEKNKVKILLLAGVNVNSRTDFGFTPLYFAVGSMGDDEIITMLLDYGALINVQNNNGISPLHYAAWGTATKLKLLINAGADIKQTTSSGLTAFDLAKDNDQLKDKEIYRLLDGSSK